MPALAAAVALCFALAPAYSPAVQAASAVPPVARLAGSAAPAAPATRQLQIDATAAHPAYSLYVPSKQAPSHTTLLVLHGMGGNGDEMAAPMLDFARAHGWLVVAPTIQYGDWLDPEKLGQQELRLIPQLSALAASVRFDAGVDVDPQLLVLGFSRGAQAALRLATLDPRHVRAVAAFSAGTYTLPEKEMINLRGERVDLPFPYGVADLQARSGRKLDTEKLSRVRFLVGVGTEDTNPGDVPRQWDSLLGSNRLERAKRFEQTLEALNYQAELAVTPGAQHELTGEMIARGLSFLARATPAAVVS